METLGKTSPASNSSSVLRRCSSRCSLARAVSGVAGLADAGDVEAANVRRRGSRLG